MGTHAVLLREPQSNAAKVFLFGESGTNQRMKLWRFFADDDTLRLPPASFADSASVLATVQHPDTLVNDLFCNGHSVLPDGRMLFIGGNYQPRNACETVYTFDPAWFGGSADPWTLDATMAAERWYATATALPDGRVLAAAGEARSWFGAFGGSNVTGAPDRVWHSLAIAARWRWGDTTAVPGLVVPPAEPTRIRQDGYTAGQFPPSREDHALAAIPVGNAIVFGGRQVLAGNTTTLGDVWRLQPSRLRNDSTMTWGRMRQVDNDPTPGVPEDIPPPRSRAAMVWAGISWGDTKAELPAAESHLVCFLFGGRDADGHVFGDLWRGELGPFVYRAGIGMTQDWVWTRLLADDPSRARYGHSMWFDPGLAGVNGAPHARLLIFGGQISDVTLASDRLFTYGVGSHPAVAAVWDSVAPDTGYWGRPQARSGAMATTQRPRGSEAVRKFFLYGGQDAAGNLLPAMSRHSEAHDSHLWALTRSDTTASPNYRWEWVSWSKPTSHYPLARSRGGMAYDSWSQRLVVVGGDTNGEAQAGGLSDSIWCIQVEAYGGGVNKKWFQPEQRDTLHPPMGPRAGLSLLAYGYAGYINESSMETYNPAGNSDPCGPWPAPQGQWQGVTTQDSLSQRAISAYPFLFVLPDGRLFNAGPSPNDNIGEPYKRFYDLTTNRWSESDANHIYDAAVMGSAVMYRPGRILRAGSHGPGDVGVNNGRTETVAIAPGQMPAWVQRIPNDISTFALTSRLNHNLTIMPTGDVLATGGVTKRLDDGGVPVRRPQLWRVALETWNAPGDSLREDPKIRNYHSAALLLPDGRVMTSGGEEPSLSDRVTASIYEPPYLFSGNEYARRPVIAGAPEALRYGEPFTLAIDTTLAPSDPDSIRSVALLRPAAVTHGFDQNQRYVPLDFVVKHSPARLLAWAPSDSNVAPPGEYMLFVTRGRGTAPDSLPVPSLAKWVVVRRPTGSQRDSLDVIAPRGGAYLQLSRAHDCENNLQLGLIWDAPADDDTLAFSGKARGYNLRWTPNSSPPHFNLWQPAGTAAPQVVHSNESAVVTGIQAGIWYRFALKAVGDNADTSSLSNELVANWVECEGGSSGGGGGSHYGTRAQTASRSGWGQAGGGALSANENSLFAGVPLGALARDVLRLRQSPGLAGGQRRAFIRQGQSRGLLVSHARLLAADHSEGTTVVATPTGELLAGTRLAAAQVRNRLGRDVTASATGTGAEPVYADSGEVLEVTLPEPAVQSARTLLLELMGGGGRTAGVTVLHELGDGSWAEAATVYPRREWDEVALPGVQAGRVRLAFHGAFALRFAGELAGATAVTAQAAPLADAMSAYSGGVFDAATGTVDTSLAMVAGDTLSLLFADLPSGGSGARTWLLEVAGTPVAPALAQARARRHEPEESAELPVAFALHPAAPNPTRGTVRLAFDLPTRAHARLEVFDAQGRRVRRLEGEFAPGRQAFEWDLRHGNGPRVAPGIYSYRLAAGAFRSQQKLVVLP